MPAVLREHFDALVLVLVLVLASAVLVLASAVLVLGRAISPVPYLVVSGRSQPMSRSGGDVQRPPRTVVDCEWRLTTKYGDRSEQIRLVGKCHFVVSDDSQSMSHSCGNVCRLPCAVVGCEWRLTTNVRVGHFGCDW